MPIEGPAFYEPSHCSLWYWSIMTSSLDKSHAAVRLPRVIDTEWHRIVAEFNAPSPPHTHTHIQSRLQPVSWLIGLQENKITIEKNKQHNIQQNKITLVQSPSVTLGQETKWAYSTTLLSPHENSQSVTSIVCSLSRSALRLELASSYPDEFLFVLFFCMTSQFVYAETVCRMCTNVPHLLPEVTRH